MSRRAVITRKPGSTVYEVTFMEDARQEGYAVYLLRWTARRAARRWVAHAINPVREVVE